MGAKVRGREQMTGVVGGGSEQRMRAVGRGREQMTQQLAG
jgi:hypothetical protein